LMRPVKPCMESAFDMSSARVSEVKRERSRDTRGLLYTERTL
jgi:hypothetical protein